MAKKIVTLVIMVCISCSLVGCDNRYPKIGIYQSVWEDDMDIYIGNEYKLKDYEKVINDDNTCNLIINFEKKD